MEHSEIYPVITLYQPWAHWVVTGLKTIETRVHSRFSCLNGKDILIHAGKTFDNNSFGLAGKYIEKFEIEDLVQGAILGMAHVSGFRRLTDADSQEALIECYTERYGLFLTDVEMFKEPISALGSMGIWYFDMATKKPCKKPETKQSQVSLF